MSESKNTPGPWQADYGRASFRWYVEHYDSGNDREISICEVSYEGDDDKSEANARLIAAAPELRDALQALVAQILDYERVNNLSPNPGRKYCWDNTERAVAAIAKAEGRAP